jgi:hypothetical protein
MPCWMATWSAFRSKKVSSAGFPDQMQLRPGDDQIAEQNARTPEAEQAEAHLQALNLGVGSFAESFSAVNDQAARIGLEIQRMPVERGQIDASSRCGFYIYNQPLTYNFLESS